MRHKAKKKKKKKKPGGGGKKKKTKKGGGERGKLALQRAQYMFHTNTLKVGHDCP